MKPSIPPMETTENPYAPPPPFVEPPDDAEALLKATTRMYRGIGWGGVVYVALASTVALVVGLPGTLPENLAWFDFFGTWFSLWMLFFVLILRTANRLAGNSDRLYRRARWLAILAAAIFFPILTIPGVLAVRRLERYRNCITDPRHEE